MKKYTLTINNIKYETKNAITLCFNQPKLRKLKYLAGQYITLELMINGRKYSRPYSFSSAPSIDSFLEITVKRVPNGIVSNYINESLKIGDTIEVVEPMGSFIYNTSNEKQDIYLWGVGSGITPLYSLVKEIVHNNSNCKIHLIYGNKSKESTIFYKQLNLLQQSNPSNFEIHYFYSQMETNGIFAINPNIRINKDFIIQLLSKNPEVSKSTHYICGPNELKNNIFNALVEYQIPVDQIHFEFFEKNINQSDLTEVEDSNVKIIFKNIEYDLYVPKGKNILDVALDKLIDIPYSCQTGDCNSCRGSLIEGQLKMIGLSKETNKLDCDEYLLCCSYPKTKEVKIVVE